MIAAMQHLKQARDTNNYHIMHRDFKMPKKPHPWPFIYYAYMAGVGETIIPIYSTHNACPVC